MSEWSNEPVLKTGVLVRVPGVRIPLSPPGIRKCLVLQMLADFFFFVDIASPIAEYLQGYDTIASAAAMYFVVDL